MVESQARLDRNPADESAYRLRLIAVYLGEARFRRVQERRTGEASTA